MGLFVFGTSTFDGDIRDFMRLFDVIGALGRDFDFCRGDFRGGIVFDGDVTLSLAGDKKFCELLNSTFIGRFCMGCVFDGIEVVELIFWAEDCLGVV
jgi:hypothetical protein